MIHKRFNILCVLFVFSFHASAQLLEEEALDTIAVFEDLELALQNPASVYRLDLTRNRLKDFPTEIFQLTNLNELILDKNKISTIPNEIATLKYLQRLSVAHNALDSLPIAVCLLSNLQLLNVADNFIPEIPDEIEGLVHLKKFFIWDNPVEYYPNSLAQLTELEEFDVLHNLMNVAEQERIQAMLPNTRIHFSPPCNCDFGDE